MLRVARPLALVVFLLAASPLVRGQGLGPCGSPPQVLYVCTGTGELCRVDNYSTAPVVTIIGFTGPTLTDIAVHPTTGQMYGCDFQFSYTVDKLTGATAQLGFLSGYSGVNALEFSSNGVLYARNRSTFGELLTIDLLSGQANFVGNTGSSSGGDLAWDGNNVLFAVSVANVLEVIDPVTAAATFVATLSASGPVFGLEIDCNQTLYASTELGELTTVDKVTGALTSVGVIAGLPGAVYGIAFDRQGQVVQSYCTAGTSSHGCNALIAGTGTPSASANAGFQIDVSGVEGQKQGLIFYGTGGQQALPWGPGSTSVVCVKPPLQRTPVQASGGTFNLCDGTLSLDWNAFMATHPAALGNPRSAGQTFDAQAWYRDPPVSKTTNLSDGLHFSLAP